MCRQAAARFICAVHSLGRRTWQSHKESLPTPTCTRSLAPTLERDGGRATCPTLLGLCPPPDGSDSELELSAVRHQPEGLDQLQAQTKFTKKELQSLYRGFKNVSAPHPHLQAWPWPPALPFLAPGCWQPFWKFPMAQCIPQRLYGAHVLWDSCLGGGPGPRITVLKALPL